MQRLVVECRTEMLAIFSTTWCVALGRQLDYDCRSNCNMYSAIVLCCSCCALNAAAAGSIYMMYL
jgi:hypothetical protein